MSKVELDGRGRMSKEFYTNQNALSGKLEHRECSSTKLNSNSLTRYVTLASEALWEATSSPDISGGTGAVGDIPPLLLVPASLCIGICGDPHFYVDRTFPPTRVGSPEGSLTCVGVGLPWAPGSVDAAARLGQDGHGNLKRNNNLIQP